MEFTKHLWCDLETFSPIDIRFGAYKYSEDVKILLFGYAVNDEPAKVWDLTTGEAIPEDLKEALEDPKCLTHWHNGAGFDTVVLRKAHNFQIDLPPERVDDTMVQALSHGLVGSLGGLCDIYKVASDKAKDRDGSRLVHKFCKPRASDGKVFTRQTDPEDWAKFVNYCRLDIEAMREVAKMLPEWNWQAKDKELFQLDQRINRRGMLIDVELARACVKLSDQLREENSEKARQLTSGEVDNATQRDALLKHLLEAYGVSLPDLRMATVEKRLNDDRLPPEVKELLALRLASTKTSVAKYKMLLGCAGKDGRIRGCLQFRGASRTGRYAGRYFQPQNLPRPVLHQWEIDLGIEALKEGWAHVALPDGTFSDPIADPGVLMSSCLRGCIQAPEGSHLVVADLSNIEGRMLAYLAGEDWKVEAFRKYDAGLGPDLYKATYARTFGIKPEEVTGKQRQIGKVMELALGYQGGVGAFVAFAGAYRLDLDALADHVQEAVPSTLWIEADGSYEWFKSKGLTHGLSRKTFTACEAIKRAWRQAHPAISAFWKNCEEAAYSALCGRPAKVRGLTFAKNGSWLRMVLPSGRSVCYASARLPEKKGGGIGFGAFSYMGLNQYTRKWERINTHGGKLVENATQAAACDVLVEAMPRIEKAGFRIVLSVHDEFITEAPLEKKAEELSALMSETPPWAPGFPLDAKGFESFRYKKD